MTPSIPLKVFFSLICYHVQDAKEMNVSIPLNPEFFIQKFELNDDLFEYENFTQN